MMADYGYLQHVMEENIKLKAQISDILPWAILGARVGVTDSSWDDAKRFLDRIQNGEFGDQL
jgi:hypothetical protein